MAAQQHRVRAVLIVARTPGQRQPEVYLRRGHLLPAEVPAAERRRLVDLGLIELVKAPAKDKEPPSKQGDSGAGENEPSSSKGDSGAGEK